MSKIESLMRNSASTHNGWTKTNEPVNHRIIRIGNAVNCNDDSIICDMRLKKNIEDVLDKYDICTEDYLLNEINTQFEYSYELRIKEANYEILVNKMLK
jgi:hypothetical protein